MAQISVPTSLAPAQRQPDAEDDVCISYARFDDVPFEHGGHGWVSNLRHALDIRLAQLTGRQSRVRFVGHDHTDDMSEPAEPVALVNCAVLVPVVSLRYVVSKPARQQLARFVSEATAQGGITIGDHSRICKVMMTPVPAIDQPSELRTVLGYEFFAVDRESGKIRMFDEVFGPQAEREFWLRLDDLTHDIAGILAALRP